MYDVFGKYRDGIHKITREQYMDYYHGLCIDMTFGSAIKENKKLPKCFIEDSFDANIMDEWVQNEDKIYRLSNQILNMQYCVNKKVVRFWKPEILNWNESEKIEGRFLEG